MPLITSVEPAPRPQGAVAVHVDGAPFRIVPQEVARRHGIAGGQTLSDEALAQLAVECDRAAALEDAFRYLSYRPRSRRELELYLRRRGHGETPSGAAVQRCEQLGYVNDREFAVSFARERIRLRPRGTSAMLAELGRLGVDRRIAANAVAEAFEREDVSERDLLAGLATRRARQLEGEDPARARRRLVAYLVRRGFSMADVLGVLDALPAGESG